MKKLTILQLYPEDMNIYGDWGNVLTLKRRLEWRGYEAELLDYNIGGDFEKLTDQIDIIVGGGGQDSGQEKIHQDLLRIGPRLKELANDNMPMLVICGLYQLFGKSLSTKNSETIEGVGLFDATTKSGNTRITGNILIESNDFGEMIGYENHSGQTILSENQPSLGRVIQGAGNNETSGEEGARVKNVIGSYMHGSLLPRNPQLADFLLEKALERKTGQSVNLGPLDDSLAEQARRVAKNRPR